MGLKQWLFESITNTGGSIPKKSVISVRGVHCYWRDEDVPDHECTRTCMEFRGTKTVSECKHFSEYWKRLQLRRKS